MVDVFALRREAFGLQHHRVDVQRGESRELRGLRVDTVGIQRQLQLSVFAGACRHGLAQVRKVEIDLATPGHDVDRDLFSQPKRQKRLFAPVRRASKDLVDAFQHFVGVDQLGVDVVCNARDFVGLVCDHMGELWIVAGPAQQEIVIGNHQVCPGQGSASRSEGTSLRLAALLATAVFGASGHRTRPEIAQAGITLQQGRREIANLGVGSRASAGQQNRVGVALLGK